MNLISWNIVDTRNGNVIVELPSHHQAHTVKVNLNKGLNDHRYKVLLHVDLKSL
jgi:hypothetical protein